MSIHDILHRQRLKTILIAIALLTAAATALWLAFSGTEHRKTTAKEQLLAGLKAYKEGGTTDSPSVWNLFPFHAPSCEKAMKGISDSREIAFQNPIKRVSESTEKHTDFQNGTFCVPKFKFGKKAIKMKL